jgi:Holliday junction DNA helicase RuvA
VIARLRGTIDEKGRDHLIVDVNGVGYLVYVSGGTLAATGPAGSEVRLHVHTHVREDALQLFGFLNAAELETFEKLLGVTGVGTRTALSFLTQFSPDELSDAVSRRDSAALARVKGVGKRTAERLILELQGKLGPDSERGVTGPALPSGDDAAEALVAWGYSAAEAAAALALVPPAGTVAPEDRVRLALQQLDRLRS